MPPNYQAGPEQIQRRPVRQTCHRHAQRRDRVVLGWLEGVLRRGSEHRAALDVGSGFVNYVFMLNARLEGDQSSLYRGLDISTYHLGVASSFSKAFVG
jgi:hypothetical protein